MDGFTYRGKHCEMFGCYYIPDESNISLRMETFSVESVAVTGRDGSYYFGTTVGERTFKLDCYFENISKEKYAKLMEWLRRDKSGELIFDERPYVKYSVRPIKAISPKQYIDNQCGRDIYSGTFTIEFVANEPFGKMTIKALDGEIDYNGSTTDTNILPKRMMPPSANTDNTRFFMYNCGTEKAHTVIRIAGNVDPDNGLTITNTTNGTMCRIIGLDDAVVPDGAWIEIDSESGQVNRVLGDDKQLAFEFHDLGYIRLDPAELIRDVLVTYKSGERVVFNNAGMFSDVKAGQYVYLDNQWRYIGRVIDENTIEINVAMDKGGTEISNVATMNVITLSSGAAQSLFEMDYTPVTR